MKRLLLAIVAAAGRYILGGPLVDGTGIAPAGAADCDNPIAKIASFAKRHRITGTPTTMQLVAAAVTEWGCSNGASRLPS